MRLTRKQILALRLCKDRRPFLKGLVFPPEGLDAAGAVEQGATLDDLLWVVCELAKDDAATARIARLLAADYAARVLHILEAARPDDNRSRNAILVARRFANGDASAEELAAARYAAENATWVAAGYATWDAHAAAWAAAWAATRGSKWVAAAAAGSAREATRGAEREPAREAAWPAEREWQLARLIAWFSDTPPEPLPLPEKEGV